MVIAAQQKRLLEFLDPQAEMCAAGIVVFRQVAGRAVGINGLEVN